MTFFTPLQTTIVSWLFVIVLVVLVVLVVLTVVAVIRDEL